MRSVDVFAPYRVFGITWSLAIGLADLKFSYYQHDWSAFSWLVLLTGVFSMMLGFFIVGVAFLDRPILTITQLRKRLSQEQISERRLFWAIILLSVLYGVSLLVEAVIAGGLPAFVARPDRARVDFGVFGIHLFVTMMPSILLLGVQYLVLFWKNISGFRKSLILAVCLIVFISFSFLLQRFSFVMWVVPTFVFVYYMTGKFRFRHILLLGGIVLGFFQVLMSIRITGYVENYIYVISRMKFPVKYAFLAEPYMYITMNLENFARSVELWKSYSFGYFSFDFLMALSGLKHPLAKEFGLVERPFLISGYNTFSFLMPFYQDFGVLGVAMIPLCLGSGIGYIYHVMRRNPTLANVTIYGFGVYILVISFFIHALGMLTTFSNLVLLLFVYYFVLKDRQRYGSRPGVNM
ncbi:MAG: O-antigen polymerase [Bacteroidota bacterium]|jgi:oligosaccharide repeat unit polymerase